MNNNLFNLPKIIDSLNKGLTLASKAIPVYQKIKPIISNKDYLNNILNLINKDNKEEIKEIKEIKKVDNNLPTFFQ
jgi:hypothetical protein